MREMRSLHQEGKRRKQGRWGRRRQRRRSGGAWSSRWRSEAGGEEGESASRGSRRTRPPLQRTPPLRWFPRSSSSPPSSKALRNWGFSAAARVKTGRSLASMRSIRVLIRGNLRTSSDSVPAACALVNKSAPFSHVAFARALTSSTGWTPLFSPWIVKFWFWSFKDKMLF